MKCNNVFQLFENVHIWDCNIFCCLVLLLSTQCYQLWYFKCKRFMFLMKDFFPFCNCCYNNWSSLFFPFPWQPLLRRQIPSTHQCGIYVFMWYLSVYGLARSHDKLKSLQQLLWLPTHKVKWTFDPLILLDHMTYWNHYISTTTVPMVTKLGSLMFFPWGATIQMTLRSCGPARSYDELKIYIYYYDTNDLQHEIQWGGEIQWEVPIHKAYGHVRSCDKLKTYIHFHNACHTCKCGDILQGTHTHKFAWPLNEVTWHKINLLYLHLQKPHEHWIR